MNNSTRIFTCVLLHCVFFVHDIHYIYCINSSFHLKLNINATSSYRQHRNHRLGMDEYTLALAQMHIHVYACVCIYTDLAHTCVWTHADAHICVCIHTDAHTCVCIHTDAHTCVCIHTDAHTCVVFTQMRAHTCVCAYTDISLYAWI